MASSRVRGRSFLLLGRNIWTRLSSTFDCLIQGALLGCILCLGATLDLFSRVKRRHTSTGTSKWWLSCFAPCLPYQQRDLSREEATEQESLEEQGEPEQRLGINPNPSSYQQEFKVCLTSHNALSIEILDGGICLESSSDDDDIWEDAPLTRIQQAIQTATEDAGTPIEKLDLFASHFRANLTADMMASILQVLPPLEHLQLGGLSLPVQELCRTLAHPSLSKLSHLALYDLVFHNRPQAETTSEITSSNLCLEEVVAVFIRLEDQDVTLDPLLNFLQSAPLLRQFELVMDHSHAYLHGYPRPEVLSEVQPLLQPAPPKVLFSASAFSNLLQATSGHLQLLFLEYVPLTDEHFRAMAAHGQSVTQLRLRDDPEIAGRMQNATRRLQSLATLLRDHPSLHTVTLDGLWSPLQTKESLELFQVLPLSRTISSLRLRSLPMRLGELNMILYNNTKLQNLSLHNIAFSSPDEAEVHEEAVFVALVQILKKDNSTLRRITWKEAEFRRTEVFPRHRKPKTHRCYHQHKGQSWTAQQQLHWYLTLNQRGIRFLMADIDCSRNEFLDVLWSQTFTADKHHPEQTTQFSLEQLGAKSGKGILVDHQDTQDDGYALDCLFYMLSNNPSLCSSR